MREIGKLGITPYAVQLERIDKHIDARVQDGDEKTRAKGEMRSSVESGKVSQILYDGKGERYSLLYGDGKTTKDVIIHPPLTRIRRETLAISRETPQRAMTRADTAIDAVTKDIGEKVEDVRRWPLVAALAGSQSAFVDDLER
jgi:hypothetical protein